MRITVKSACLPVILLMTACQPSGLYDQHGNYHSAASGYEGEKAQVTNATDQGDTVAYSFNKPGFYDSEGRFVHARYAPEVPDDFLPPEGMCRIYQPDRALSVQPPAKPCQDSYYIPTGAYVIYGG